MNLAKLLLKELKQIHFVRFIICRYHVYPLLFIYAFHHENNVCI
jgi:hypothetical protein